LECSATTSSAIEIGDTEPLERQEAVSGRRKDSGAPLGRTLEAGEPGYADDPDGRVIGLDAHVRRANPRTPESSSSRILRRGYFYRRPGGGRPDLSVAGTFLYTYVYSGAA
jgi:deferrochelatase/peroxidase EfeB